MIEIKPYEKNAKKHPESQLKALAKIVKEVGWRQPALVNQEGVIVAGHGRWMTWVKYGEEYKLKPIWVIDDKGNTIMGGPETTPLTAQQEKTYRFADNKLNESDWDMKLASVDLLELDEYHIDLTGFDRGQIINPNDRDDDIPVLPTEARSQLGDLYELGGHRVLCGDSTSLEAVLRVCGDSKVDMLLTDPPYNVDYEGKSKAKLKIENDKMDDESFRKFLASAFIAADQVMKKGATFYIWHADSEGYNFRGGCRDVGWQVRQCLIWKKNTMVMGRQDYHWSHEPCLYGWKDGASHLWNSDRTQTTILNFDRPIKNKEHPTMKPVDLLSYQITNNTKGEDIVLDLFLGSGSTLIAAQKTGRICFGIELDPKYVDVIVERYVEYSGSDIIKKNGKELRWETIKTNK